MLDHDFLFFSKELVRLIDDYFKCDDDSLKEQIEIDIILLSKAIALCK
ncbi:hypothetical protein [Metabacillus fastidiosus]